MPRLSDAEIDALKAKLTERQYAVAFEEGTEPAFSHPLHNEKRAGVYDCAVCQAALFSADAKYDSGSGWPSFWRAKGDTAIDTKTDYHIGYARTEMHCANCGAHLGHVFDDGPPPSGLRYCANGTVLDFRPEGDED